MVAPKSNPRAHLLAALLAGSGCAALIYQTVWFRELRLIFGSSTAAIAAVTVVFMGCLGAGSWILGERVERQSLGVRFYGKLELAISLFAAASLALLPLVGKLYFLTGGSFVLGRPVATILRFLGAVIAIGAPAFLMGGTLPAAARGVEMPVDARRSITAMLYGTNTLGAVVGVLVSTFVFLERLGNRRTLLVGFALNIVVALIALHLGRTEKSAATDESDEPPSPVAAPNVVFVAAAAFGFVFLLMEQVWYRMLAPLLGGSTFTYGLILAVALFGIGAGGLLYRLWRKGQRPSLAGLAITSAFEAVGLAIPLALGDRLVVMTAMIRSLDALGFAFIVAGWTLICVVVVLPASLMAGIQFPLLIALLGEGRRGVGADIGRTYVWNTGGAIVGSVAGGFGILPLLGAIGAWKLAIVLLSLIAVATALMTRPGMRSWSALTAIVVALILTFATTGPTSAWRNSPVGAGRVRLVGVSMNDIIAWLRFSRREVLWQTDGVESHIGALHTNGYALVVNGKPDGHSLLDAGTQIMAPLTGSVLHGAPHDALVIGLGTGSSAGWLAAIPTMQRVDVVELEPAVLKFAELCAAGNRAALRNERVHVRVGDAREFLLTTRNRYSLIFSEPSNPFRSGVASLFTKEYYEAAARHLREDGVFLQWVQMYDIDAPTFETIVVTLHSVFPHVQTWTTMPHDVLLVASSTALRLPIEELRRRLQSPPYASAMADAWDSVDAEGFLAHFVAGEQFSDALNAPINTDDRNRVEFGAARSIGSPMAIGLEEVRRSAHAMRDNLPLVDGAFDSSRVAAARILNPNIAADCNRFAAPDELPSCNVAAAFRNRDYNRAAAELSSRPSLSWDEYLMLVESEAQLGDERAATLSPQFIATRPAAAAIVRARLAVQQRDYSTAMAAVQSAFRALRRDPFIPPMLKEDLFACVAAIVENDKSPDHLSQLYRELQEPFPLEAFRDRRFDALLPLAERLAGCGSEMIDLLHQFEPSAPWSASFLAKRAQCYGWTADPRARQAAADLAAFESRAPAPLR